MFIYSKLRGRIKEKCSTQNEFACKLGISSVLLSGKLNNKSQWSQRDIVSACSILDIDASDIPSYFFCEIS